MSWQPIEDINKKILYIRKRVSLESEITFPSSTMNHFEDIDRDVKKFRNAFKLVNEEAQNHQEGGKIRDVLSPDNMTVPTEYMSQVVKEQKEQKGILETKRQETFDRRKEIEEAKGEKEEEIRQLYAEMKEDFSEKKRCLDEALYHRDG